MIEEGSHESFATCETSLVSAGNLQSFSLLQSSKCSLPRKKSFLLANLVFTDDLEQCLWTDTLYQQTSAKRTRTLQKDQTFPCSSVALHKKQNYNFKKVSAIKCLWYNVLDGRWSWGVSTWTAIVLLIKPLFSDLAVAIMVSLKCDTAVYLFVTRLYKRSSTAANHKREFCIWIWLMKNSRGGLHRYNKMHFLLILV